jgi:hypothetical protein
MQPCQGIPHECGVGNYRLLGSRSHGLSCRPSESGSSRVFGSAAACGLRNGIAVHEGLYRFAE